MLHLRQRETTYLYFFQLIKQTEVLEGNSYELFDVFFPPKPLIYPPVFHTKLKGLKSSSMQSCTYPYLSSN